MGNIFSFLGKCFQNLFIFLNNFFTHLSAKWQEEQISTQYFYNSIHWNQVSVMLQEELYFILKSSPYDFLNQMFCSDNINYSGWETRQNDVVYFYDIYTSTPPTDFVLEQVRQKLNIKIAQYQRQFIQQCGFEEAALYHPCIYHGMYITSIKQDGIMIRFEIITHLSHCCA